jgi:YHS domain-containing protein
MMTPMTRILLAALLAASSAGPINETCPVSGEKSDGKLTSEIKLGFCCANCKGRFDRDPLATLHKLDKIPVDTCPLSGKAVGDATSTVTVAFCREECKRAFDREPGKYLARIQAAEKR